MFTFYFEKTEKKHNNNVLFQNAICWIFLCVKSPQQHFFLPCFFCIPLLPPASSKIKIDFWNKSCGHSLHFFADPGASYYNYNTYYNYFFFWEKRKLSIKILKWTFHLYILLLITFKKGVMPFVSEKCNMMPSPHSPISRHMFWKINEYTDILILLYILHFFWFTNIIARFWYLGISGICM